MIRNFVFHRRSIRRPGSTRLRRSSGRRGFTLVEVMVALVVFAVGVLSLGILMPLGTRKVTSAGSQTDASSAAASVSERLLNTPYDDSDLDSGMHNDDANNPYPGGAWVEWNVELDQPVADCKRVTINAHWPTLTATNQTKLVLIIPRSGG